MIKVRNMKTGETVKKEDGKEMVEIKEVIEYLEKKLSEGQIKVVILFRTGSSKEGNIIGLIKRKIIEEKITANEVFKTEREMFSLILNSDTQPLISLELIQEIWIWS